MKFVSYIIIGIMIIIYFTALNNTNTGKEIIDYHLHAFYHANMSHLIANGISFISLSFMEEVIGWQMFLFAILFIWIVSSIILYSIHNLIPSTKRYTIGFSGIIFGLIVLYYSLLGTSTAVSMIGLVVSIIPQLLIPGISFEGHLSGIIAGVIFVLLFNPRKMIKNADLLLKHNANR